MASYGDCSALWGEKREALFTRRYRFAWRLCLSNKSSYQNGVELATLIWRGWVVLCISRCLYVKWTLSNLLADLKVWNKQKRHPEPDDKLLGCCHSLWDRCFGQGFQTSNGCCFEDVQVAEEQIYWPHTFNNAEHPPSGWWKVWLAQGPIKGTRFSWIQTSRKPVWILDWLLPGVGTNSFFVVCLCLEGKSMIPFEADI